MGVGVLTAFYGVAQQIIGHQRLNQWGYAYNSVLRFNGGFLRSISTFALPFSFGFFLMMVIVICLPVALADLKRRRNQLFVLVMPLLAVGLITSIVRAAMLGLLVGVLYIGFRRFRSVFAVLVPLGLARAVLHPRIERHVGVVVGQHQGAQRQLDREPHGDARSPARHRRRRDRCREGAVVRPDRGGASRGLRHRPEPARPDVYTPVLGANGVYQPDNYYLKTLVELGVLGLWFLMRLLIGAVREEPAPGTVRESGRSPRFGIGITAFFVAGVLDVLLDLPRAVPDGHVLLVAPRRHRRHGPRRRAEVTPAGAARRSCGCSTV